MFGFYPFSASPFSDNGQQISIYLDASVTCWNKATLDLQTSITAESSVQCISIILPSTIGLTTSIELNSIDQCVVSNSASLNSQIFLQSSVVDVCTVVPNLTVSIELVSSVYCLTAVSGTTIDTSINLNAVDQCVVSNSANLNTGIVLLGSISDTCTSVSNLYTSIELVSSIACSSEIIKSRLSSSRNDIESSIACYTTTNSDILTSILAVGSA